MLKMKMEMAMLMTTTAMSSSSQTNKSMVNMAAKMKMRITAPNFTATRKDPNLPNHPNNPKPKTKRYTNKNTSDTQTAAPTAMSTGRSGITASDC